MPDSRSFPSLDLKPIPEGVQTFRCSDYYKMLSARKCRLTGFGSGGVQIWTLAKRGEEKCDLEFTVEDPQYADQNGDAVYLEGQVLEKLIWLRDVFIPETRQKTLSNSTMETRLGPGQRVTAEKQI